MSEYDMSIHTNPDARVWAKFFMETWEKIGRPLPDEEMMIGWFANAMMAMHDHLKPNEAADKITALRAEVERREQSFDLRWKADMRAIKRWQEAHPGNDLNWPDHADLVVWLLERDAALRAENERLRAELREMDAHMEENITLTEVLRHEQEWVLRLSKALRGIIRVADRNTVEFNEARAALEEKQ